MKGWALEAGVWVHLFPYFVPGLPGKLLTSVSPSYHLRMGSNVYLKYFAFRIKGSNAPTELIAGEFSGSITIIRVRGLLRGTGTA